MLVAGPLRAKLRQLRQPGVLGVEHVLRVHGRALEQRPSRSQESRPQILPMGAVHTLVSSVSILHTTPDLASFVDEIRPQHSQSSSGGSLLPVVREVSGPRQDHALHAQVSRPVLVHAATPKRRHQQEVRLRHTAAVLHGRFVLLLRRLQQRQHGGREFFVGPGRHRRHLFSLPLLSHQALLPVQLAGPALLAERSARPQELSPVRHRDHAEHHAGPGRVRLGLLSARDHVRL